MKRVFVIFLFIIAIISYKNVIFASYSSEAFEEELYQQIEATFKERSRIWNRFLIGQYISIDEIEEDLNKIIVDPLLKFDIEMFEQMLNDSASYEGISNVTLKNINIVKSSLNKVEVKAIIIWNVLDYGTEYIEEVEYTVKMENIKGNWFLSNYEISK